MKSYIDIFTPSKIGGKFFLHSMYVRIFIVSITCCIFSVMLIKLQGQVLSIKEITILSQLMSVSAFFVPLLAKVPMKTLCIMSSINETLMAILPLVYLFDLIDTRAFLYTFVVAEFYMIIVAHNLTAKLNNAIQGNTKPETAEHRTRGIMIVSASGFLFGSILILVVNSFNENISALLYVLTAVDVIGVPVVILTNRTYLRYFNSYKAKAEQDQ